MCEMTLKIIPIEILLYQFHQDRMNGFVVMAENVLVNHTVQNFSLIAEDF